MRTALIAASAVVTLLFGSANAAAQGLVEVPAFRETAAVASSEDAADDPALWADPASPRDSRIIATDKKGGLYVYDLNGREVQFVPVGNVNNVDIRAGFPFAGGAAPIVISTNRDDQSLAVFRFDVKARKLDPKQIAAIPTGFQGAYGFCLHHKPGGDYFAVATSKDGEVKQWRLTAADDTVKGEEVRDFELGSIAEGCVADDELGTLYISQEDVALWKLSADPTTGDARVPVAPVGPLLEADIEGVGIITAPGGKGYLVASSQGNSRFVVFERDGKNRHVGTFVIVHNNGIDDVSGTDGLDVSAANFGPDFPGGLLVVQDDVNTHPLSSQNFKLVPWAWIAKALGLKE